MGKCGLGKQVQELMQDSGLKETTDDPEWNIFNRLYDDALRRQAKIRQLEKDKGVYQSRPELSLESRFSGVGLSSGASLLLGSASQPTLSKGSAPSFPAESTEGPSTVAHFVSPRVARTSNAQLNRHLQTHLSGATDEGFDQLRGRAGLSCVQQRHMKQATSLPAFEKLAMGKTMPVLDAPSRPSKSSHAHQPPAGWLQIGSDRQASSWNSANVDASQGSGLHPLSNEP